MSVSVEFSVCAFGRVRLPHADTVVKIASAVANNASIRGARILMVIEEKRLIVARKASGKQLLSGVGYTDCHREFKLFVKTVQAVISA